jgi:hypothetical protein
MIIDSLRSLIGSAIASLIGSLRSLIKFWPN